MPVPASLTTAAITQAAASLQIRFLPTNGLEPDPRNARQHSAKQVQQIAKSIEAFGFNVPILIDGSRKVLAGHGRLAASILLGRAEVPTITLEHLTPEQARAFMVADNRLTDTSTWDDKLLAEQLQFLAAADLDFDLDVIGFETAEIDLRIQSLTEDAGNAEPDVELPSPEQRPISKVGDLWQLGRHRLLCGNALDPAAYIALLGDRKADVVFTDPPYNVAIHGHVCGNGAIQHREFAMAAGEMTRTQFTQFLTDAMASMRNHSRDGAIHFVCMDWRHAGELLAAGEATGGELKNLCVWDKGAAGMGSFYRSQHELVFVFKHGSDRHTNNVQLGRFGRYRTNVWKYPGVNSFARHVDEGNLLALHPTVKPTALVADALLDASERGDAVLDPFLGSGTTLLAAERTGRIGFGIELDPLYVDTAIRRWQRLTGEHAIHAASGERFDDLMCAPLDGKSTLDEESNDG
jgi:DNA modification methylase